jgi:cell wall-associated NlpC family hydrolase
MAKDRVLEIAHLELCYTEGRNNDTKFGKWYGLNFNPWCAMFVSWVFHKAGDVKLVAASSRKGFASCEAGLRWFAKNGRLRPIGKAKAGDIAFFQFDNDADADHVGIVLKNNKRRKSLTCYEGNTSSGKRGSQSNGDGVYLRKRPYSTVISVARPKWSSV